MSLCRLLYGSFNLLYYAAENFPIYFNGRKWKFIGGSTKGNNFSRFSDRTSNILHEGHFRAKKLRNIVSMTQFSKWCTSKILKNILETKLRNTVQHNSECHSSVEAHQTRMKFHKFIYHHHQILPHGLDAKKI